MTGIFSLSTEKRTKCTHIQRHVYTFYTNENWQICQIWNNIPLLSWFQYGKNLLLTTLQQNFIASGSFCIIIVLPFCTEKKDLMPCQKYIGYSFPSSMHSSKRCFNRVCGWVLLLVSSYRVQMQCVLTLIIVWGSPFAHVDALPNSSMLWSRFSFVQVNFLSDSCIVEGIHHFPLLVSITLPHAGVPLPNGFLFDHFTSITVGILFPCTIKGSSFPFRTCWIIHCACM